MKKLTQKIIQLGILSLLVSGCDSAPQQSSIQKSKVVTIATQASHPPFAYINKDKKMVGFDITLINDLCAFMLIECKVVHEKWDSLLPGLQKGKYNAVIAAVSSSSQNQQQVDFTDTYYEDKFALIVNKNAKVNTHTMRDATIAVLHASEAAETAEKQYPEANITGFKTQSSAFLSLEEGTKDAVYADEATISEWQEKHNQDESYEVITNDNATKKYAIAVQKDSELTDKLNAALVQYKKSGEYQKLYDEYFVKTDWEKGLPLTAFDAGN